MKTKIKIEHGVPLPSSVRKHGEVAEAIKAMNIGDSFVFPAKDRNTPYVTAKRLGIKLRTRRVDEDNIRLWRVA